MIEYKKVVEGISEENGIGTLTSSPSRGTSSLLVSIKAAVLQCLGIIANRFTRAV